MTTPAPPAAPVALVAPVAATERIVALDIVRGFALFGVLLVNMQDFAAPVNALAPRWPAAPDRAASWLLRFAAEGKFITIFAFLFGVGFALQLLQAQERGERLMGRFVQRLVILLTIGLLHYLLLWKGDILVEYALTGFALILFARSSPQALLRWAGGLFALYFVVLVTLLVFTSGSSGEPGASGAPAQSVSPEEMTKFLSYTGGDYGAAVAQRLGNTVSRFARVLVVLPLPLSLFVFGLYVGKRGILREPEVHIAAVRRFFVVALPVGLVCNAVFALFGEHFRQLPAWGQVICGVLMVPGPQALGLAYAAGLWLLLQHATWLARLRPLAAVGRTALTNYLLQSVVCTTFFYGYGFGWYNRVSPATGVALTVALFVVQVPLSIWWLRSFRFGPAEWVWRSLTYLRPMPFRREPSLSVPGMGRRT